MEEVRKLYEERKMTALLKLCQERIADGRADFDVYACCAYAQAARNNFSRLSLEEGMEMFQKAAELCGEDADKARELYENFTKEVRGSIGRVNEMLESVSLTKDIVLSYRDCMRLCADALVMAAAFAADASLDAVDILSVKKEAVSCMVKLCAVYRFEQDLGKVAVKKVDNAPDEIRQAYNEKYDVLVADILKEDASYEPEEIQRERVDAEHPEKPESAEAEAAGNDGKAKKKSLIDKLLDFF